MRSLVASFLALSCSRDARKKENEIMQPVLTLRRRRLLPLITAICVVTVSIPSALAWTHNANRFDLGGDPVCGQTSSVPCIYWPEPNHVSGTDYFFDDPTLTDVGPAHFNFISAVGNATGYYNAISGAFNPFLYNCQVSGCIDPITYKAQSDPDIGAYGLTS